MFIRVFIFLLIFPFLVSSQIIYTNRDFNSKEKLVLNTDNSFNYYEYFGDCDGNSSYSEVKGNYILKNSNLKLNPLTELIAEGSLDIDIDTNELNVENYVTNKLEIIYQGQIKDSNNFIKIYDIIRINKVSILINPKTYSNDLFIKSDVEYHNEYSYLANIYNSKDSITEYFKIVLTSKLHNGNVENIKSKKEFLKAIPKKEKNKFLNNRQTIRIKKANKKKQIIYYNGLAELETYYLLTLNKGSNQGIYLGMIFYFQNDLTNYSNIIITKVKKNKSYATYYTIDSDFNINKDYLSTYNPCCVDED